MPYPIEILAVGEALYAPIEAACNSLNQVQREFAFSLPSKRLREKAFVLAPAEKYKVEELRAWLIDYRATVGGNHPYLILVVDAFLYSNTLHNLFARTWAKDGLTVFTTHGSDQFVHDVVRFCRYYFTNAAIRFFEPDIRNHGETRDCIFDKKIYKKDLILSLNSGRICEECSAVIAKGDKLNLDVKEAISELLQVVSNQHPVAIVMKGGGVKGLALAGALLELEKYFSFNCFAGTAGGAVAAVLLGAGYKPTELLNTLRKKDFNDFCDAGHLARLKNFRNYQWLYPGNAIKAWIRDPVRQKIDKLSEVELSDLPLHTIVYASREKEATMRYDSKGKRRDTYAHIAARCSMAILYYFSPEVVDGVEVYDGGLSLSYRGRDWFIDQSTALRFSCSSIKSSRQN
jgi:Patatin-like phospholipase